MGSLSSWRQLFALDSGVVSDGDSVSNPTTETDSLDSGFDPMDWDEDDDLAVAFFSEALFENIPEPEAELSPVSIESEPKPEIFADDELIISVSEMISFIELAAKQAALWTGMLVLYAGDNTHVTQWIDGTPPRNPYARFLMRVPRLLQVRPTFVFLGAYIRTCHIE